MCCTIFCVPTSALLLNDEVTSIEYLDNGDRIETVISYKAPDKSSVTVNSSTKTATKTKYYKTVMVLCCGQYQSRAHFLITEVVQNAQVVLIVQPHHHMLGL